MNDNIEFIQQQSKNGTRETVDQVKKPGIVENKDRLGIFSNLTKTILPRINSMPIDFQISESTEEHVLPQIPKNCQLSKPNCQFHLLRKVSTIKSFNISDKGLNVLIKYKTICNLYLMECLICKIRFISAYSDSKHDNFDGLGLAIAAHYNSSRILK